MKISINIKIYIGSLEMVDVEYILPTNALCPTNNLVFGGGMHLVIEDNVSGLWEVDSSS